MILLLTNKENLKLFNKSLTNFEKVKWGGGRMAPFQAVGLQPPKKPLQTLLLILIEMKLIDF